MTKERREVLRRQVAQHWTSSQETVLTLLNVIDAQEALIADCLTWIEHRLDADNAEGIKDSVDVGLGYAELLDLKARAGE